MTLRGMDKKILHFSAGRAAPRWVIPLRYSRNDHPLSTQVCPICLRQDEDPYFRLRWRLAFVSCCPKHSVRLLDECPRCAQAVWPRPATIKSLYADKSHPLHACPICNFDLRQASTVNGWSHVDTFLKGEPHASEVSLGSGRSVSAVGFGEALWAVCQLFLRARPRSHICRPDTEHGRLALALGAVKAKSAEFLPATYRHELTSTAAELFTAWPEKFLSFSLQHGIKAELFSESRSLLPIWFQDVVEAHLARQKRGITVSKVQAARQLLLIEGRKVTKAALGRLVGSKYGGAVQGIEVVRVQATQDEKLEFLQQIDAYARAPVLRKSSKDIRLRNALVLLFSIIGRRPLREVLLLENAEVEHLIFVGTTASDPDPFQRKAAALLVKLVRRYERRRSGGNKNRSVTQGNLYFQSFCGGPVPERAVQKILFDCMKDFDLALKRHLSVFRGDYLRIETER
jgi:hypothetical protein